MIKKKSGSLLLPVIAGILFTGLFGCANLPTISRTAIVHDVTVGESLSIQNIEVQPGDEVRWVNLRRQNIRIDIPNLKTYELSCQRGFSTRFGSLRESVTLKPNETSSICFEKPAVVRYNVRMETAQSGGNIVFDASIAVGNPAKP